MDLKTYKSLRYGDRLIVEQNGRLRVARVKGWAHGVLCCQLHRHMSEDWCAFVIPVYRGECVQVTHRQGQRTLDTQYEQLQTSETAVA